MVENRFPELPWHQVAESISRAIFAIETPEGTGSGFLISIVRPKKGAYVETHGAVIGTAWHVIADLYGAGQKSDFKIIRWSDKIDVVPLCDQVALVPIGDKKYDTGAVICLTNKPIFAGDDLLPILPNDVMLARGAEVAWMGFPGLVYPELCFFHGHVSGYISDPPAYLIDGVAINGVSGGPVFDNRRHLIGFVSAYIPNRLRHDLVLPGLSSIIPISIIRGMLEKELGVTCLDPGVWSAGSEA